MPNKIYSSYVVVNEGWTEEPNGEFSPIGECLINQYDQFAVDELKDQQISLNGKLTLDENFPDNGGLLEAYKAYKLASSKERVKDKKLPGLDKFTADQLYFLGFATVSFTGKIQLSRFTFSMVQYYIFVTELVLFEYNGKYTRASADGSS